VWSFLGKDIPSAFLTISFPLRLEEAPTFNWIGKNEPSTPACPGTVADPKAAPGQLCLYVQEMINASAPTGMAVYTGDFTSGIVGEAAIPPESEGYGVGTWAVTAE
jgi:hypothetical protein